MAICTILQPASIQGQHFGSTLQIGDSVKNLGEHADTQIEVCG